MDVLIIHACDGRSVLLVEVGHNAGGVRIAKHGHNEDRLRGVHASEVVQEVDVSL
jgi:hypothetical protein